MEELGLLLCEEGYKEKKNAQTGERIWYTCPEAIQGLRRSWPSAFLDSGDADGHCYCESSLATGNPRGREGLDQNPGKGHNWAGPDWAGLGSQSWVLLVFLSSGRGQGRKRSLWRGR